MAGLLDWLTDGGLTADVFGGGGNAPNAGTPMQPGPGSVMPQTDPMGNPTGGSMPLPTPAPAPTQPMPPVQGSGMDAPPLAPAAPDPSADGLPAPPSGASMPPQSAPPVPVPQPRPPGADMASVPAPTPAVPPGNPLSLAPPAPGPSAPANAGQTWLGKALGLDPSQSGKYGQQMMSGLAAGLKAVPANTHAPGLAAFAGTAGAALEGADNKAKAQKKEAADYLKASIDARKAGDEAGYKQNYLLYLKAKQQADTDKAASKDASTANKNDTPTQLYLSAQRLVQPDRNALNKQIEQMRKEGADPATIAQAQAQGEAAIAAKLNDHYATLGIHPQQAQALGKQPGNSQENPIDAGKLGITKDNIGQKLQPGQYYTNPADGKVYQYKGPQNSGGATSKIPAKPTSPEPANPTNTKEMEAGKVASTTSKDDEEDDG